MLKARKKTTNLRYITQLFGLLYILIIGLTGMAGIKILFLLEI